MARGPQDLGNAIYATHITLRQTGQGGSYFNAYAGPGPDRRTLRASRRIANPLAAVGMPVARRPPHRSVHALLTHTALISDVWRKTSPEGKDVEFWAQAETGL
jgi:hypothetical protein